MPIEIFSLETPSEADWKAIWQPLYKYNGDTIGSIGIHKVVALRLRENGDGETEGGLWGEIYWNWLHVNVLFVPKSLRRRGLGAKLLTRAEELARRYDCIGVWLDTFSFQAPDFYRKCGYEEFGRLPNYPNQFRRTFFCKRLEVARAPAF